MISNNIEIVKLDYPKQNEFNPNTKEGKKFWQIKDQFGFEDEDDSLEQLLLIYAMKEKYSKSWNGEEWI